MHTEAKSTSAKLLLSLYLNVECPCISIFYYTLKYCSRDFDQTVKISYCNIRINTNCGRDRTRYERSWELGRVRQFRHSSVPIKYTVMKNGKRARICTFWYQWFFFLSVKMVDAHLMLTICFTDVCTYDIKTKNGI